MPDLMQTLFDYIIDHTHETYCLQTRRAAYQVYRDSVKRKLEEQLTEEQRELFEEFQKYSDQAEMEELYAMFLAAFDLSSALFHGHMT